MMKDPKKYTLKNIAENLSLLEEHLKDFSEGKDEVFCMDCMMKHLLTISGLSKECVGFKCEPDDVIKKIQDWSEKLLETLKDLARDAALTVAEEARGFRKKLQENILERNHKHRHLK